jgi:hypothetical protein
MSRMNYFRPFSVTLIQDIYTLVTQEYINVQATYKNISVIVTYV